VGCSCRDMKIKIIVIFVIFSVLLFFVPLDTYCGNTAQQNINFSVQAILEISVSGNPQTLTISSIDPLYPNGEFDFLPVEDGTTLYDVTANVPFRITGELSQNMVQGAWIFIKLEEPSEGYSLDYVVLNDNYGVRLSPQTVLVSDPTSTKEKTITYKFAADVFAGVASGTNTVILTVLQL